MLGSDTNIWDVAVDATHVYWVSEGGVRRVAKGGGGGELLAHGRFRFSRLALDATAVYWGDATLQGVLAVAKRGGKPRFVTHGSHVIGVETEAELLAACAHVLATDDPGLQGRSERGRRTSRSSRRSRDLKAVDARAVQAARATRTATSGRSRSHS